MIRFHWNWFSFSAFVITNTRKFTQNAVWLKTEMIINWKIQKQTNSGADSELSVRHSSISAYRFLLDQQKNWYAREKRLLRPDKEGNLLSSCSFDVLCAIKFARRRIALPALNAECEYRMKSSSKRAKITNEASDWGYRFTHGWQGTRDNLLSHK